jgi:opacity protein-like surface antigen
MKKFLFLAVAFVAGLSAMAQQKADEVIKVSADKYDFGKIKQGVPVTTYFTLTNTTDKPVVIENAWAGCGCTTPEYSKEPIPAGGTSKLKVGYNAAAMGHFEKQVNIKLAGVNEPKVVTITGEVVDANSIAATTETKAATPVTATEAKTATKVKVKTKKS